MASSTHTERRCQTRQLQRAGRAAGSLCLGDESARQAGCVASSTHADTSVVNNGVRISRAVIKFTTVQVGAVLAAVSQFETLRIRDIQATGNTKLDPVNSLLSPRVYGNRGTGKRSVRFIAAKSAAFRTRWRRIRRLGTALPSALGNINRGGIARALAWTANRRRRIESLSLLLLI